MMQINNRNLGAGLHGYVLVVDDEVNILKLVSANLQIRGYHVLEANNGTEALDKLHSIQPALLVLDIKLPDFTGWELLKRIENDPLILTYFPVLIMTASIAETSIDLEAYPNVTEILIKPFSTAKLISAVEHSISHR